MLAKRCAMLEKELRRLILNRRESAAEPNETSESPEATTTPVAKPTPKGEAEDQVNQPVEVKDGEPRRFADSEVPETMASLRKDGHTDHMFDPIITLFMDETFTNKAFTLSYPVPDNDKIWNFMDSSYIPRINLSENPSAISVLEFLRELRCFGFL